MKFKGRYGERSLQDVADELKVKPQTLKNWMIQIDLHSPFPQHKSPISISRSDFNKLTEYKKFKERKIKVFTYDQAGDLIGYSGRSETMIKLKRELSKLNPERYQATYFFTDEEVSLGILYREKLRQLNTETARKYQDVIKEKREGKITEEEKKERINQLTLQKREKLPEFIREIYEKEILPKDLAARRKFVRGTIKAAQEAKKKEEERREKVWQKFFKKEENGEENKTKI